MSDYIEVNTASRYPTHFLRAVELIGKARGTFQIPSENWPYPTKHRLGTPGIDPYYAEIWVDGMDWQKSYWAIETVKHNSPVCLPFIVFEDHKNSDLFNEYDFDQLVQAALYDRRDRLWVQKNDGYYNDSVWFYLKGPGQVLENTPMMRGYQFEHASQPAVQFYMNSLFVPERPVTPKVLDCKK